MMRELAVLLILSILIIVAVELIVQCTMEREIRDTK